MVVSVVSIYYRSSIFQCKTIISVLSKVTVLRIWFIRENDLIVGIVTKIGILISKEIPYIILKEKTCSYLTLNHCEGMIQDLSCSSQLFCVEIILNLNCRLFDHCHKPISNCQRMIHCCFHVVVSVSLMTLAHSISLYG